MSARKRVVPLSHRPAGVSYGEEDAFRTWSAAHLLQQMEGDVA